ncbi:GNAT family N-acetyltransferase [Neiella marina]|uniref:GNAT family N-acetyltransferase n=1 Tax=Neiella holothuriorum TaxID=2870530 RepID=A0ABS7EBQ4_9GAMM|nr:GNAT family N-acetyltransferase [Neiella holothuriorum]MBW8189690.1 GNAT family N-acetyltransferase [Neiella holothuriorum]
MEWRCWPYHISTDKSQLQLDAIHHYLTGSYWAAGITKSLVKRTIQGSLCFGIYRTTGTYIEQIGFARVITDGASFAYLADVYVLTPHRGSGLSKWLMHCVNQHPQLQGLRRFMLATRDAHGLYEQFGFSTVTDASTLMMRHQPNIYQR